MVPSGEFARSGEGQKAVRITLGRLVPYFFKSALVVGVLFALSRTLPMMPAWSVALALAVLSLVGATGSTYRLIVNKTYDYQKKFAEGSIHKGTFKRRIVYFIGFYILSAIFVASILLESPTWDFGMWVVVFLAVPIYIVVAMVAGWFVGDKEKAIPLVKEARVAKYGVIATSALLCIALTAVSFMQPTGNYAQAIDAFMAAPKPFEGSPSALMRDAGELLSLVEGLRSYALTKLTEGSWHAYLLVQVLLNASAMSGVASMISVCLIEPRELMRVFQTLEKGGDQEGPRLFLKSFLVVFALSPIVLSAMVIHVEKAVADQTQEGWHQLVQKFVRDQVKFVVYEIDGKYYDPEAVADVLAHAREESESLSREAEAALVPLVNASFDARVENVDRYLDWYYGIFTHWEVLINTVTADNAEAYVEEQLESRIEQGVDDSELNSTLEKYYLKAESLQSETLTLLDQYESTEDYPEWLMSEVRPLDIVLDDTFELSDNFVKSCDRLGFSTTSGAYAGVLAKKSVGKIADTSVYSTIVSRIRVLGEASAEGARGGFSAFAVVVIRGFGMDIAMVKADELANRGKYWQELVDAINEQREETLAAVKGSLVNGE